jgi:hypothetical protein
MLLQVVIVLRYVSPALPGLVQRRCAMCPRSTRSVIWR